MKKTVLVIHHGSGIGGGLIALVGLIEKMQDNFDITVLCIFNSNAVDYLIEKDIKVEVIEGKFYSKFYDLFVHSEANFSNIPNYLRSFKNLILYFLNMLFFSKRQLYKFKDKYDILYLNSLFLSDWLVWGKRIFKKTVIHVREPLAEGALGFRKGLIRSIIKRFCDQIVAISHDNADRLDLHFKTVVLLDPVLERPFKSLNIDFQYKYFVYVGGSQRIKGFQDLINCLEFLDPDIKIFFVGPTYEIKESEDTLFYKVRSLFSKYLRKDLRILKHKYLNSENLIKIGSTNDVFDYYNSALGLIAPFAKPHACLPILEAMSIGKSSLISDIDGMNEFVSHLPYQQYKTGNARDLANKINDFSKFPSKEIDKISRQYLRNYSKILDEQSIALKYITNELKKNQ